MMRAVGIKILRNKLSEYVRLAASGETVLVIDRGRVVAELSPPQERRTERLRDAELVDTVHKGLLTPPAFTAVEPPPRSPVASWEELRRELAFDREDG